MLTRWIVGAWLAACALASFAQEAPFPQRGPIELTVLFPAGSSADITARLLADGIARQLSATVVVVNRPGAGGAVGYRHVAGQKPDGYTLVWNSNSISTTYHSGQLPFDYHAFDPVARVLVESPVLAVRGDARWKTLADFLADAKAHPNQLTVGNSGLGSHTHISSVALFKMAGVGVVDVPYPAAQVMPSLLGGHIDAVMQLPAALATLVKSGQVRVLAALVERRDPALPDVPTAREQGVDVALDAWRGIAVPRGTPPQVVFALQMAIRRTVESPEFAAACERLGVHPAYLSATEFGELIAKEDVQLAGLMQVIGLKK
ncbi:tripartite tricarboxylate transporter substrate binding protein [Ramlibacter sp. G-1-2-2]|uniref:Tripartite tricarboxylate transporter substrate binding protein n=1 Tax=Ramlibacter agri TaxID=2728837 RepID=A0A848H6J3_9BURK|nr:tripartite tricarboxylate transporter substrate binding protein [Ramlibacter agri]NML46174.1 tripartite tricarboxylate transporter substrate binding protein [Ramlibacter agri]